MINEITLTVADGEEEQTDLLKGKAASALGLKAERITALNIEKKSIDARHGRIAIQLRCKVYIDEQPPQKEAFKPLWQQAGGGKPVIIVGSGPAGLFAALKLLEAGLRPIIVERGSTSSERKKEIAQISREHTVNSESNYCFGEGGAGTFSDGKLYTRSKKRGSISHILELLHYHGADPEILSDAHPHIGSDKLPVIIKAIRDSICAHGGEFLFNSRCVGLTRDNDTVTGIELSDGRKLEGRAVILATGHSARDVYQMLAGIEKTLPAGAPAFLEAKTFAMGVRLEHPRALIDSIQYHGQPRSATLPAATYRLTCQADGRGVYSFCMCPGGLVVPSATADNQIVLNGMSASSRNARWSNAAIVVETRPEDIPAEFKKQALDERCPALAGLYYQQWLEEETARRGKGQAAPAQRLTDFLDGKDSETLPESSYSPGLIPSRLDRWLPEQIRDRLDEGLREFGAAMRGFITKEAVLIASETRTSSPVRVLRDSETLQTPALRGLFPSGEGSGYSGGIVSSAIDGENVAEAVTLWLASSK